MQITHRKDLSITINDIQLQRINFTLNDGIKSLLKKVEELKPCDGIQNNDLQEYADLQGTDHFRSIQRNSDGMKSVVRSNNCHGHVRSSRSDVCQSCRKTKQILTKRKRRTQNNAHTIKAQTPLAKLAKKRLIQELKTQRLENKELQKQLKDFKKRLEKETVTVTEDMHDSLVEVLENNEVGDFAKLFWMEQKKNFKRNPKSRRWHPMIIKLALTIHSQGPKAYKTLRDTGILTLPGESTLRDYTNYFAPKQGFQQEVNLYMHFFDSHDILKAIV